MKKMRAAVVGYGGMGGWHVEHLLKSDVCELAGIYDIRKERTELAQSRGIHAYASYEELLADETVELITVAIPNDSHEEVVIAALNAGKNVICEKPVTLSLESLERMIAAAEKNGVRFTTHQNRRWDVDYLSMKQIYDSGEIGKVLNIESRVHGSRGIPSDWRGEKEHGGGMLYDWGIHLIDQILMIFGWDVKRVYCVCDHITNKEVDDGFRLELTFASGQRATVELGTYNFIAMPRFYLRAEKGTALITDWREDAQVVKCKHWHENDVLPVKTAAGLTKTMAPRDEVTTDTYTVARPKSDVHDFYRHYVNAIRTGGEQDVTYDQMRTDLKIILAAFESDEKGMPIEI
ncbi:MAG: Gfo/Idh/MocA family oxidoreductase [Ruminococcaceae bacterium]|nr:Gfo/Idh/MocA family oxidoreductase [Oscillospiraceae bacterium]